MVREDAEDWIKRLINEMKQDTPEYRDEVYEALDLAISDMEKIEKYEQAMEEMLTEINTPNRNTCDYYIVDQIENIINGLRKEVL